MARAGAADLADVARWLTDVAEPFDDDVGALQLRAVPVRLERDDDALIARVELSATTRLARTVDLLFALALHVGADVAAEEGLVNRAELWLAWSDEQDRLRVTCALDRADAHGKHRAVSQGLWSLLGAAFPGRDVRWDAKGARVVQLLEVGDATGVTVEAARSFAADPQPGDVVAAPVGGYPHTIAWRWLSEAFPGLAAP